MTASPRKQSGKPDEENQFLTLSETKHRALFKVTLLESYSVMVMKEVLKNSLKE